MPDYLKRKIKDERGLYVVVYGRTQEELEAKYAARKAAIERAKELQDNPLVWMYARSWYATATSSLGTQGRLNYAVAINNHICPVIGELHMLEVTSGDLQDVMRCAEGLSRSAQSKIVNTLHRMFRAAAKAGLAQPGISDELKAGGARTPEKTALTAAQSAALLDAVRGLPVEGICMLGLYAGLRREEILGLRWDCVHLDDKPPYLQVRRALRWEHNKPDVSEELKSATARRDIPIPQQLVDWLRRESARSGSVYVIHNAAGGPVSSVTFKNFWHAVVCRSAGSALRMVRGEDGKSHRQRVEVAVGDVVPKTRIRVTLDFNVTPHKLRHTYITNLILSGANIKKVQYLAGHAQVATTLDIYSHLVENSPERNDDAVLAAFGPRSEAEK